MSPRDERKKRYRPIGRKQAKHAARRKAKDKRWREREYEIDKAKRDGHYVEPE